MIKKHTKKLLIPHEENNHQPHILRGLATKIFLGIIVLVEILILVILAPVFSDKLNNMAAVLPSVLVSKTNESRVEEGKNQLVINDLLVQAAQMKADDMAEKGYFSHVSPGGETPWYWVNAVGYKYDNAGENLAVKFVDSDDVHNAWMDSPTHKANILRGDFEEIGIATAKGYYKGEKVVFAAQFFGDPKEIPAAVPIVNKVVETPVVVASVIPVKESIEAEVLGVETEVITEEIISIPDNPTTIETVVASPRNSLSLILNLIFIIVAIALILKISIKVKIQHPKLIINGLIILIVISALLLFNSEIANQYLEIV